MTWKLWLNIWAGFGAVCLLLMLVSLGLSVAGLAPFRFVPDLSTAQTVTGNVAHAVGYYGGMFGGLIIVLVRRFQPKRTQDPKGK